MLKLMIWVLAAVSVPFLLGGVLYGPADFGFEFRSPKSVISPVRAQLADQHGWVQEKLEKIENTLEDAHRFVTRASKEFRATAEVVWNEGIPLLKERLRRPFPQQPRSDVAE